jgi:N-acetyl-anhydromuramyl-L-alanine amidase AmpD
MGKAMAVLMSVVLAGSVYAEEKPPTTWNPAYSGNYTAVSYNRGIQYVIIHTVEGSYQGCISWFKNPSSNVSAHYVVAYTGAITQMVKDKDIAWHASSWNTHSIGIEHEGYASQNGWTAAQYAKSAALTRWICLTYGIPMTRQRILGHNEVSSYKSDPGPHFNWNYYMSLVTNGSAPPPPPPTMGSMKAMKCTTSTLNVRSGPSTSYSIIGSVANGQAYVSIATSGSWHKVYYKNNTGWCHGGYMTQISATGVKITVSSLNVRTGPGTGYSAVGTVSLDQRYVQITTSGGWRKIWWGGGAYWVYGSYTSTFGL